MSGIRQVKPSYFESEAVARLSLRARLTFIALLTQSDDWGNARAHPAYVLAHAYPFDLGIVAVPDIVSDLGEIEALGFITPYTVGGIAYYRITGFMKHQVMRRRRPRVCPVSPFEADNSDAAAFGDADDESADNCPPDVGHVADNCPPGSGSGSGSGSKATTTATTFRSLNSNGKGQSNSDGADPHLHLVSDNAPPAVRKSPQPRKRANPGANGASAPATGKSWLVPARDAWQVAFDPGSFQMEEAAKWLAPLYDKGAGLSPEEIGTRLRAFLAVTPPQFATLKAFAGKHGAYSAEALERAAAADPKVMALRAEMDANDIVLPGDLDDDEDDSAVRVWEAV